MLSLGAGSIAWQFRARVTGAGLDRSKLEAGCRALSDNAQTTADATGRVFEACRVPSIAAPKSHRAKRGNQLCSAILGFTAVGQVMRRRWHFDRSYRRLNLTRSLGADVVHAAFPNCKDNADDRQVHYAAVKIEEAFRRPRDAEFWRGNREPWQR